MIDAQKIQADVAPHAEFAKVGLSVVAAPDWTIATDEQYAAIGAALVEVKRRWKLLDEARKTITGPIRNAERNTNAFFAKALEPLSSLEMRLKRALGEYDLRKEAARMKALATASVVPPPSPEVKGVTTRVVRRWRVVNEDKVPRQFCSPDEKKVEAHLRAGGIEAIPGIEFYDETITTVRT
jgi:hypothetical protein